MKMLKAFFYFLITSAVSVVQAAEVESGLSFHHKDWNLVCDNTRHCRAVGYQSEGEGDEWPVSLFLMREAGPHTSIKAGVKFSGYGLNDKANNNFQVDGSLTMRIDRRSVGTVELINEDGALGAELSNQQVRALLSALSREATIEWVAGRYSWKLSDQGASAVLLKMDEFQGRIGTPGAIIRKGTRSEKNVRAPLPVPVIQAVAFLNPTPISLTPQQKKTWRKELGSGICSVDDEHENSETDDEFKIVRLSSQKLLVVSLCGLGAYNRVYGYWVINRQAPYSPELIIDTGLVYDEEDGAGGRINEYIKWRATGQCWYSNGWVWNGSRFIHTQQSSSGKCNADIPYDETWELHQIITHVREPKSKPS